MALNPEFPSIYLLPTRLQDKKRNDIESRLSSVTRNINEAEVVAGNISRKERALFELRRLKVTLVDEPIEEGADDDDEDDEPRPKRQKTSDENTVIRVVKLSWLIDSLATGRPLPFKDYLVYEGIRASNVSPAAPRPAVAPIQRLGIRKSSTKFPAATPTPTTSSSSIPSVPDYLKTGYSCQRPTPANPPNASFTQVLQDVRTKRRLCKDLIGTRAYSTAIAALSAYPHILTSAEEVERLPGCSAKISELYHEWAITGKVAEAEALTDDPEISCLKLFDSIWGVGETTAREFYSRNWRELDDIVEFGWEKLTRWQQVGIKYYDEFQKGISRPEAEKIGEAVLVHANKHREGFHMVICGGYRKGKNTCHDVDVLLSHPDPEATYNAIEHIVAKLEQSGLVSHVLSIKAENSKRGQKPTPWKGNTAGLGAGFDTLDKAMVVWYDSRNSSASPALHCRLDIVVTPWRTKGCAVLGWCGDTTFQRDLRRYCKKELALKFDSSGVRSREDGKRVDFEQLPDGRFAADMEAAEKMVFKGLELTWREPDERCTG